MTAVTERLTRGQLYQRILAIPDPAQRRRAILAAQNLYGQRGAVIRATEKRRDPDERRKFVGDPWRYLRDVFGGVLSPDQEAALELVERNDRVLLPSGNNVGKTWLLAGYGLYRFDAVASLPDEDLGLDEQGCILILPGPDHPTIKATIYSAMLELAAMAERRGYPMPGRRSENSVYWTVRPRWFMEPFSPSERVGQEVAHTASGRHHRNQVALIEEGQGVPEPVWRGAEGMCSGEGNKVISPFNPTESRGPAFTRAKGTAYKSRHLSALNHPNVLERRAAIPAAISYRLIDSRIRDECRDIGPAATTVPDDAHLDFVYALPPSAESEETGPREDGVRGHPLGTPRVYRPGGTFAAQVLGRWPMSGAAGLFDGIALDQSMERWSQGVDPETPPDLVGVDPARFGKDNTTAAGRWGDEAATLLRRYADAVEYGPEVAARFRETNRMRIGAIRTLPKADGPDTAVALSAAFPRSPIAMDDGGVGSSPYDHLKRVLMHEVEPVSFAGVPAPPGKGEPWSENVRTQIAVRLAMLVNAGLVDVPNDPLLRQELLALELELRVRTVTEIVDKGEQKVRKTSVLLIDKEKLKKILGRSPDLADCCEIAANGNPVPKPRFLLG